VAHVGDGARRPVRDRLLHSPATSTWRYTEFSMSRDHPTLTYLPSLYKNHNSPLNLDMVWQNAYCYTLAKRLWTINRLPC
jgi:hypothetical protein